MRREEPFLTCDQEFHNVVYDFERAESVCSKCGLVLDDMKFDLNMESNATPKGGAKRPRRHAAFNQSLGHPCFEANLRRIFHQKNVQTIVLEKALELYSIARRQRLLTGYSASTLSAALMYTAHRLCRIPMTLAECTNGSATEKKKMARCLGRLCRKLQLNIGRFRSLDYLALLVKKKKIDDDTIAFACRLLETIKEKRLAQGTNPIGVAAAALYIAGSMNSNRITQKEWANVALVSEVTVRASCRKLKSALQTAQISKRNDAADN